MAQPNATKINGMATWEDGPEYAPIVRPDDFAVPQVPPLELAPRRQQSAAEAPIDRPSFHDPQGPVAPLAALVPQDLTASRDPGVPFEVVASTVTTTETAWSAAHWSHPTSPLGDWGAPTGAPVSYPAAGPVATQPALQSAGPLMPGSMPYDPMIPIPATLHPAQRGGHPVPGTPEWFGPGPQHTGPHQSGPSPANYPQQHGGGYAPPQGEYGQQAGSVGTVDAKMWATAVTPGLLIVLVLGGLITILSPVLLATSFWLATRVKVATSLIRKIYVSVFVAIGLIGLIAALNNDAAGFGTWWSALGLTCLLACWAMLITIGVLVYRALTRGSQPTPPPPPGTYTGRWG